MAARSRIVNKPWGMPILAASCKSVQDSQADGEGFEQVAKTTWKAHGSLQGGAESGALFANPVEYQNVLRALVEATRHFLSGNQEEARSDLYQTLRAAEEVLNRGGE
jgi:hypothetical protein